MVSGFALGRVSEYKASIWHVNRPDAKPVLAPVFICLFRLVSDW